MEVKHGFLRESWQLADVPDEYLEALGNGMTLTLFNEGEVLFDRDRDEGDTMACHVVSAAENTMAALIFNFNLKKKNRLAGNERGSK
eukprot:4047573-Pyramimonas_sp.AAC.2